MTNDQSGRIVGDLVEQLDVEALVDDAVEAEPRPRQVLLVGRVELARTGLGEMGAVDATRGSRWTLGWRSFLASNRL